ncbi:hypothetical protein SNEBB_003571 [Seison nebaliae]|nr:hypothetical protein SNEBB_003571 [Seison nebaliae]
MSRRLTKLINHLNIENCSKSSGKLHNSLQTIPYINDDLYSEDKFTDFLHSIQLLQSTQFTPKQISVIIQTTSSKTSTNPYEMKLPDQSIGIEKGIAKEIMEKSVMDWTDIGEINNRLTFLIKLLNVEGEFCKIVLKEMSLLYLNYNFLHHRFNYDFHKFFEKSEKIHLLQFHHQATPIIRYDWTFIQFKMTYAMFPLGISPRQMSKTCFLSISLIRIIRRFSLLRCFNKWIVVEQPLKFWRKKTKFLMELERKKNINPRLNDVLLMEDEKFMKLFNKDEIESDEFQMLYHRNDEELLEDAMEELEEYIDPMSVTLHSKKTAKLLTRLFYYSKDNEISL